MSTAVAKKPPGHAPSVTGGGVVPVMIAAAGDQAARRFLEFFAATIRNKNTRMAYYWAAVRFFAWCDHHKIGEIVDIEPLHVAAYVEGLGKDFEKPTVKQHLAAIRMLFDWLVTGQVVATNPAHRCAVQSTSSKPARPRCSPANRPASFWTASTRQPWSASRSGADFGDDVRLARIGAAVAMRVEDYYPKGKRWWVRLHEKGGKRHEMPAHHNLEAYLDAYIKAAGVGDDGKAPCSAPPPAALAR